MKLSPIRWSLRLAPAWRCDNEPRYCSCWREKREVSCWCGQELENPHFTRMTWRSWKRIYMENGLVSIARSLRIYWNKCQMDFKYYALLVWEGWSAVGPDRVIPVDSLLWKGVNWPIRCEAFSGNTGKVTQHNNFAGTTLPGSKLNNGATQHFGWKNRQTEKSMRLMAARSHTRKAFAPMKDTALRCGWDIEEAKRCKLRDMEISSIKNGSKVVNVGHVWSCMSTWAQFFIHLLLQKNEVLSIEHLDCWWTYLRKLLLALLCSFPFEIVWNLTSKSCQIWEWKHGFGVLSKTLQKRW